ncbi:MAG: RNA pseudouridine synthase [Verrucomicrobia bacterium]|nr:RNA pseudouridine synthase [Verrucomicrobiota bacterium]
MKRAEESAAGGWPLGPGVEFLTADANGLVALAKPEGVLSHPNRPGEEERSLLNAPYRLDGEYFEWRSAPEAAPRRAYLLNRLDSGTSGVILLARSEELAGALREHFRHQRVAKHYAALVFGAPTPPVQVWRDRLAVRKEGGVVRTETAGNIPAEAKVRVLKVSAGDPPLALIELEPRTGRSHQLRVQCASRHLPIVGDATYGNFRLNRDFTRASGERRLFLHSAETTFEYAWKGRRHRFTARAPLPASFARALRG